MKYFSGKSLFDGRKPLVDVFEIFLDSFDVLGELGLSLAQKLLIVAQTNLQLLLNCIQLGQRLAELKSCKNKMKYDMSVVTT